MQRFGRHHVAVAGALVLVAAASALLYRALRPRPRDPAPAALAKAQMAIDRFDRSPQISTQDLQSLTEAIRAVEPVAGKSLPTELRDSFARTLAEFIHVRAMRDVDAYIAWFVANDYDLALPTPYSFETMSAEHYRNLTGREGPPAGMTIEELFRQRFEFDQQSEGGEDDPDTIALGEMGIALYFAFSSDPRGVNINIPTDLLPIESHWYGARSITSGRLWHPRKSLPEAIEAFGGVMTAVAYIGARSDGSEWILAKTAWWYDPAAERWILDNFLYGNNYSLTRGPVW
jgi:hypothetical protein